ncbi:hypothetical protein cyc_05755 [Cyclospora cayetanensis]|uniref:Secreted protein n=1 Tax=Cyclospora cayetanensis TaxID=88456 RepID=A0A1D3D568_9EIME|nr:hypothetical protein cyc_05755 [Cyclospora cayetanensis]
MVVFLLLPMVVFLLLLMGCLLPVEGSGVSGIASRGEEAVRWKQPICWRAKGVAQQLRIRIMNQPPPEAALAAAYPPRHIVDIPSAAAAVEGRFGGCCACWRALLQCIRFAAVGRWGPPTSSAVATLQQGPP